MDFVVEYAKYTDKQEEFAREVRAWLAEVLSKETAGPDDTLKPASEQPRRGISRSLGEKGWLYPRAPRQYGGGGLDADLSLVLSQELVKAGSSALTGGGGFDVPAILQWATEEQKKRFLPPMLRGEVTTWTLFTEPEAGSDVANQRTKSLRATRENDHFVVNGHKTFISGTKVPPDQFYFLARSDVEAPRHENLSMFLSPANLPGVSIVPLDLFSSASFIQITDQTAKTGEQDNYSVFFDDVRIHESCLIGAEGDGWKLVSTSLAVEHSGGAGNIHRNVVAEKFLDQCRNNPDVAKRLRQNPDLLHYVVDIYIDTQIERLWNLRNAWLPLSGRQMPHAGPQLELYTKLFGGRLTADIAGVLGPYALTDDDERGLDDGIFELGQRRGICFAPRGTPEIIKTLISRALAIGR